MAKAKIMNQIHHPKRFHFAGPRSSGYGVAVLVALCPLLILAQDPPSRPGEHQPAASSPAASSETVQFASGDIKLAADLLLPPGEGPFPGVVIVHGSGTSDRSNAWTKAYAGSLVERGIAVLHPDKRGSGQSGGDWRTASFLNLADDALAAAEFLRNQSAVDKDRVGLIGFSQGGHIVPAAAARDERITFAIGVSSSTVPIQEQIGDEIIKMGRRDGLSEPQLERVAELHQLGIRYVESGQGWDEYQTLLGELKSSKALAASRTVSGFPDQPDADAWEFLRTIGDFDPLPYWARLKIPFLFVYGGNDTQIDIPKSIRRIQGELDTESSNYSLMLFSRNGHALFRADALDFIARWIADRGEH